MPTAVAIPAERPKLSGHRVCTPEATIEWLAPMFATVGITRVADITGLDILGIPVFQAVRPMGRSLSVSQGKGLTAAASIASAVMESIEVWHAETETTPRIRARPRDIGAPLIELERLRASDGGVIDQNVEVPWIEAVDLLTEATAFVPGDAVNLDFTRSPDPVGLRRSTNGLAGGNTKAEARASALAEVIERCCEAEFLAAGLRESSERRLDPVIVAGQYPLTAGLIASIQAAGLDLDLYDITNRFGVPAVRAILGPTNGPGPRTMPASGHGAHLDPSTAMVRAITEAAQARLAYISGNRDDLFPAYFEGGSVSEIRRMTERGMDFLSERRGLAMSDQSGESAEEDVATLLDRIRREQSGPVVEIDLTRAELGVPVVKILAPQLAQRPFP